MKMQWQSAVTTVSSSLFQSATVLTKNEFLYCSVLLSGIFKPQEFWISCLSICGYAPTIKQTKNTFVLASVNFHHSALTKGEKTSNFFLSKKKVWQLQEFCMWTQCCFDWRYIVTYHQTQSSAHWHEFTHTTICPEESQDFFNPSLEQAHDLLDSKTWWSDSCQTQSTHTKIGSPSTHCQNLQGFCLDCRSTLSLLWATAYLPIIPTHVSSVCDVVVLVILPLNKLHF